MCAEKYATLPLSGQCGPMKLMSLEEAQARSLSPNHPVHKERQRENSLPDTSTAQLYHTVIDISDSKYDCFGFGCNGYNDQSADCFINRLFVCKEEVIGEIQEVEVHLQSGALCGLEGKAESEWQCVHQSTRDDRSSVK